MVLVVSEKKTVSYCLFKMFTADNDAHGAWLVCTPGPRLAGFIKSTLFYTLIHTKYEISRHCSFGEECFVLGD